MRLHIFEIPYTVATIINYDHSFYGKLQHDGHSSILQLHLNLQEIHFADLQIDITEISSLGLDILHQLQH